MTVFVVRRQLGSRYGSSASRLVVLGSSGAWPEPGRACSGFVLEHAGFRVGRPRLRDTAPAAGHLGSVVGDGIDAVVITHHHPDHAIDLHGLFRARWFGRPAGPRIPVVAHDSVRELLRSLEDDDLDAVDAVFDWRRIDAGPLQLGPFSLDARPLPHFVPNAGVRLSADGLTVAYTGDTGPTPELADLGRDVDLFVVEASDRHQRDGTPAAPEGAAMHLSAREAGEAAAAGRAGRLLLTHFWPGNDRERSRDDAQTVFEGEVLVAEEGLVVELP